jgi:mono/diheme cytochrome c family protein
MAESSTTVIGVYDSPDALMQGIRILRSKDLGQLEAYSPYPIHGIDEVLGHRRSPLGAMVMVMGIVGALTALSAEYWISAVDYPIVTGGKAPTSWEAFVPIMFEVTVLFATFTAGLGMLFLMNRLPFFGHPMLKSKSIAKLTRDKYALVIESAADSKEQLDEQVAEAALSDAGAVTIEILRQPKAAPFLTSAFVMRALGGIAVACLVSGFLMYWLIKLFPVLPPMSHMLVQPRVDPQESSTFFGDGRSMRMPVQGTVARGFMPSFVANQEKAATLVNPLARTREVLEVGKQKFTERCAVCHGALATGTGSLTAAYGGKPANLQAQQFLDYPDGKIYWVIVNGKNAMPSQASDLSVDQRWSIVLYIRALQRAQHAMDRDVQ